MDYFGVNCSCSIALSINLNHYVKLMLFYSYFYGVNAIGDIDNFFICIIIINRVYNTIVRPNFDYCREVWDVFGETQSKRLQKLQNRAARIILNLNNDIHHTIALHFLD